MGIWDGKVVIVGPGIARPSLAGARGVVVTGRDAAAVGSAVARLGAEGVRACGFVGAAEDPALLQMATELFPGAEVVEGLSA